MNRMSPSYPTRALFVCALDKERDAVAAHLQSVRQIICNDGTPYLYGIFQGKHCTWEIFMIVTGPTKDNVVGRLAKAHMNLQPDMLLMSGIAMGLKSDASAGDVVAAERVIDLSYGKDTPGRTLIRARTFEPDPALLDAARNARYTKTWLARRKHSKAPANAKAVIAPMVTVDHVQADPDSPALALVKEHASDALALEMEGYALLGTAHLFTVRAILAKGISDHGADKAAQEALGMQEVAADASAAFLIDILDNYLVINPRVKSPIDDLDVSTRSNPEGSLATTPVGGQSDIQALVSALQKASAHLQSLNEGFIENTWLPRPELDEITARISGSQSSATVVLGAPGVGKSALLARVLNQYASAGAVTFGLKADTIPQTVENESDLTKYLGLPERLPDLIRKCATERLAVIVVDQLDALASLVDLRTKRLNIVIDTIRELHDIPNVHLVLSCREFEFRYDSRFPVLKAEPITLPNLPVDEVEKLLASAGVNYKDFPSRLKELSLIPQLLMVLLALKRLNAKLADIGSYHSAIDTWLNQVTATYPDPAGALAVLSKIALAMAEIESLWVPYVSTAHDKAIVDRFVASGVLTLSPDGTRISFVHQTVFDNCFARESFQHPASFATYVKERQNALFVRPRVWAVLLYTRQVAQQKYQALVESFWKDPALRLHLKFLLVDFIASSPEPLDWEVQLLISAAKDSNYRKRAWRLTFGRTQWFEPMFRHILPLESAGDRANRMLLASWLSSFWRTFGSDVRATLIKLWPTDTDVAWQALFPALTWSDDAVEYARYVITSGLFSTNQAGLLLHSASAHSLNDAADLFSELLKREFSRIKAIDDIRQRGNQFSKFVDTESNWYEVYTLAQSAPVAFINAIAESVFGFLNDFAEAAPDPDDGYREDGRYTARYLHAADISDEDDDHRKYTVLGAFTVAAEAWPDNDLNVLKSYIEKWTHSNSMLVQRLLAHFAARIARTEPEYGVVFLKADKRRIALGDFSLPQQETKILVRVVAESSNQEAKAELQKVIANWVLPSYTGVQVESRLHMKKRDRTLKLALLTLFDPADLLPDIKRLLATESRALPDPETLEHKVQGGWIGSPMSADQMDRASDADILKMISILPDSAAWDHPRDWFRGGSIQLSREFANFSARNKDRARALMLQLTPGVSERPVEYALVEMSRSLLSQEELIELISTLQERGFDSQEFRIAVADALANTVVKAKGAPDPILDMLEKWIGDKGLYGEPSDKSSHWPDRSETKSVLFQLGSARALPNGSYNVIRSLYMAVMCRSQLDQTRLFRALNTYISHETNVDMWIALAPDLRYLRGKVDVEQLELFLANAFGKFPESRFSLEGALLIGQLCFGLAEETYKKLVEPYLQTDSEVSQLAGSELVGLRFCLKSDMVETLNEILRLADLSPSDPTVNAKVRGLVNAAVNLWEGKEVISRSLELLKATNAVAHQEINDAFIDIFRIVPNGAQAPEWIELMRMFANEPNRFKGSSLSFVVEHLFDLLPGDPKLTASLIRSILAAVNASEYAANSEVFAGLTSCALTLQRYDSESREAGLQIFESLLQLEIHDAEAAVVELDGHDPRKQVVTRPPVRRFRRRPRRQEVQQGQKRAST